MSMTLKTLSYHRNGISGAGFYVCLFTSRDGKDINEMVATVFAEEDSNGVISIPDCRVAVLDVNEPAKGNVAFGEGNSWRGDHYADQMLAWIKERNNARSAA